jgi:hypothetical protein
MSSSCSLVRCASFFPSRGFSIGNFPVAFTFNLLMGVLFLLTILAVWRRRGIAYGVLGLLMLVFRSTQSINLGRYMIPSSRLSSCARSD